MKDGGLHLEGLNSVLDNYSPPDRKGVPDRLAAAASSRLEGIPVDRQAGLGRRRRREEEGGGGDEVELEDVDCGLKQ